MACRLLTWKGVVRWYQGPRRCTGAVASVLIEPPRVGLSPHSRRCFKKMTLSARSAERGNEIKVVKEINRHVVIEICHKLTGRKR